MEMNNEIHDQRNWQVQVHARPKHTTKEITIRATAETDREDKRNIIVAYMRHAKRSATMTGVNDIR